MFKNERLFERQIGHGFVGMSDCGHGLWSMYLKGISTSSVADHVSFLEVGIHVKS